MPFSQLRRARDLDLDLGNHIVENDLSTSTNTIYWLVATLSLIVGECADRWTDGWTDIFH